MIDLLARNQASCSVLSTGDKKGKRTDRKGKRNNKKRKRNGLIAVSVNQYSHLPCN